MSITCVIEASFGPNVACSSRRTASASAWTSGVGKIVFARAALGADASPTMTPARTRTTARAARGEPDPLSRSQYISAR
jgi:hypothetical protein